MDNEVTGAMQGGQRRVRTGLSRRAFLVSALGTGTGVLLVAACGPSSPASAPATAAAPPPPSAVASPAASPSAAAAPSAVASPSVAPAGIGASPASVTSLTVSQAQVSGSFLPDYVGVDGGIFQNNGLNVSLTVAESSTTMAALLSGEVQVGQTGGPEMLNAVAGGADVVAVATVVPVYPYQLFVQQSIQQPSDLKGQQIGITNFGSTIDLATRTALMKMGLDPTTDVTLIPLTSISARTAAMLSGQVAGGLTQPPDWITLQQAGLHSLFDLASSGIATSVVTTIVQRSYLTAHRDVVQQFVDAIVQAIAREKNDATFATAELQKILNYNDPQGLQATYQFYSQTVHPALPYPDVSQLQDAYDAGKQQNPQLASVSLANVVDRSFVQSAADRGLQNS